MKKCLLTDSMYNYDAGKKPRSMQGSLHVADITNLDFLESYISTFELMN